LVKVIKTRTMTIIALNSSGQLAIVLPKLQLNVLYGLMCLWPNWHL